MRKLASTSNEYQLLAKLLVYNAAYNKMLDIQIQMTHCMHIIKISIASNQTQLFK